MQNYKTFNLFIFIHMMILLSSCVEKSTLEVSFPLKGSIENSNQIDHPPLIDFIADQVVNEGVAITTINAGDDGDDIDRDGQAITYSCFYDFVTDDNVAEVNSCTTLTGVSFNSSTGVMNWMPDLSQAGSYEFIIVGSDGSLTGREIFSITVNNTSVAPVLDAIADQTVNEGVAIITVDANNNGVDFDADGSAITYTCYYDTLVDSVVAATNLCTTLPGATFTASSGMMDWTPSLVQSGNYEFKITGSNGSLDGSEIFSITVNNTNQAPVLTAIANQTIDEAVAMTTVNAGDGGDDFDVDGDPVTYTCFYDNVVDGAVVSTSACTNISGMSFSAATGVMNWTPNYSQSGNYEFKIIGSDGSLTDSTIFTVTVNNVSQFISLWRTPANNTSVVLPLKSGHLFNFTIDWGDGSPVAVVNSFADVDKFHTYALAGDYEIRITGIMTGWGFSGGASSSYIIKVIDMGDTKATDLSGAFDGCINLTDFAGGNTSEVSNMSNMFQGTTKLVNLDVSSFDTSKVTNMSGMFRNSSELLSLNLSNFDTSKVTNMSGMFAGMLKATSLNLSSFVTSEVVTMNSMFNTNPKMTALNLSNFNTAKVTDMSYMFNSMPVLASLNISNFNTAAVINMTNMFAGLSILTTLNLSHFNTVNVTSMSSMFSGNAAMTSLNISNFNTANVTSMSGMFASNSSITSLNLSHFNTGNVTTMLSMFSGMQSLTSLNISSFRTPKVTNMSLMFNNVGLFSIDVSNFDTSLVTNMSDMFSFTPNLLSLDLSNFVTSNVIYMNSMFSTTPRMATVNLSNFNVSKVLSFNMMFASASELTTLDLSSFVTTAATNMASMFQNCTQLTSLDISNFDTNNVTNMSSMFMGTRLPSLNLDHFRTPKVTNMSLMFYNMSDATSISLANFDTSKVTLMNAMFYNTNSLMSLNVSSFDTSKVTTMATMFFNTNIPNLNLSNFTTPLVTSFASMFQNAKFSSLNISGMNPVVATDLGSMFAYAINVTSLDLSHFRTPTVTTMASMFQGTSALTSLNASNWDITNAASSVNVFSSANAALVVTCNQGGSPGTGSLFGKTCY